MPVTAIMTVDVGKSDMWVKKRETILIQDRSMPSAIATVDTGSTDVWNKER